MLNEDMFLEKLSREEISQPIWDLESIDQQCKLAVFFSI